MGERNILNDLKKIRDNEVSVSSAISYLKEFTKRMFNQIISIHDHKLRADELVRDKDFTPRMMDQDTKTLQYSIKGGLVSVNVDDNANKISIESAQFIDHSFYAKDRKTITAIKAIPQTYDPTRTWVVSVTDITFSNNNAHWLYLKTPLTEGVASSELFVSEVHIDPLFEVGYVVIKWGEITAVVDGKRTASMLWGNVKVGGISDALKNGKIYGRKDGAWVGNLTPLPISEKSTNSISELGHEHALSASILKKLEPLTEEKTTNGAFYNGYAFLNASRISNYNAHMPLDSEVEALIAAYGGEDVAGGHLKQSGTSHWLVQSAGADNSSGFSALGSGYRGNSVMEGVFIPLKTYFHIWFIATSSETGLGFLSIYNLYDFAYMFTEEGDQQHGITPIPNSYGFPIRLIVDSPIEIVGSNAVYVGNDGKRYACKLLADGKWWTVQNLNETKFADGSLIPVIADATEWGNATGPAMCWHGNDPDIASDVIANWALKSEIPTKLSDLADDETHRTVTDAEKETWSGKQAAGNYITVEAANEAYAPISVLTDIETILASI